MCSSLDFEAWGRFFGVMPSWGSFYENPRRRERLILGPR